MPKSDDSGEYHITLRSPATIKIGGTNIQRVVCFDASIPQPDGIPFPVTGPVFVFKIDRIWLSETRSVVFKNMIVVPYDNVAGIVPQPFMDRQ